MESMKRKSDNLIGIKFGDGCEVIDYYGKNKHNQHAWLIKCKCGYKFIVKNSVISNKSKPQQSCKKCSIKRITGSRHYLWNSNLTHEERLNGRDLTICAKLSKLCFTRDGFKCTVCFDKKKLHAHHLDGWNWSKENRFDINNLITLCKSCHINFHNEYGYGNNTVEQFKEWLNAL